MRGARRAAGPRAHAAARRASGSRPCQSSSTSEPDRRSRIPALRRRRKPANGRVSGSHAERGARVVHGRLERRAGVRRAERDRVARRAPAQSSRPRGRRCAPRARPSSARRARSARPHVPAATSASSSAASERPFSEMWRPRVVADVDRREAEVARPAARRRSPARSPRRARSRTARARRRRRAAGPGTSAGAAGVAVDPDAIG